MLLLLLTVFAIVVVSVVMGLVKFGPLEWRDNARSVFKTYSLWLGVLGTALTGFLASFPQYALDVWNAMPQEFKSWIPPQYMPAVGSFFFVLSMVSKFIAQKKLTKDE